MNEGEWQSWGQAIWFDNKDYNVLDKFVLLAIVWVLMVLFLIWITA
jgi:hypothetical protein